MHHQPWLATYRNNGIPAGINADAYPSVVHLMEAAMTRYADKPAFRAREHQGLATPSRRQRVGAVNALAGFLEASIGDKLD